MCFWPCQRPKPPIVKPSIVLESPTKVQIEPPTQKKKISTATLRYLIERFTILMEEIDKKTWFQPPSSDSVNEAIRLGGLINTIKPKTKEEKRLYKHYRIQDKILEDLIKPPGRDPDIIRQKPPPPPPPVKPWWHTKVERFDMYGHLVSTQYL
jgi:hypothetical protein